MRTKKHILMVSFTIVVILCVEGPWAFAQPNAIPRPTPNNPGAIKELNNDGSLHRITGKVKILDTHTLAFEDGTEVDLNGVMDAPELEQKAMLGDSLYPCGREAMEFLKKLIGDQAVTFLSFGGKGPRPRGNCYAGETYVQEAMVRNGWAVSEHSGTELAQLIAQENKRGLWRGKFIPPKRWRKGERLPGEGGSTNKAQAATSIREAGGKVRTEQGLVVAVTLEGEKMSDATLEYLRDFSELRSLRIAGSSDRSAITDAGLASLAGLTNLESLELSRLAGITDAGLTHLQGLSKLRSLEITLTKPIHGSGLIHLRGLRQLESLDFNHTPITDEGLAHVVTLTNLKSLGLRATKITDAGLGAIDSLLVLESLNLWETRVTDKGLALLSKLPRLRSLGLVGAPISSDGLKHLTSLGTLENLEIRQVMGGDDAVLAQVGDLSHLKRLEFYDMKPTEMGLRHLGKLAKLEALLLVGSHIPDAGFIYLKGLTALTNLNLWKVPISDEGLASLRGLSGLEELHLTDTKVTDAGLTYLKGLVNLRRLGLSGTQVSDSGLQQLTGLAKLRNLSLVHARVTDEGVKKLKEALPHLDVYYR